MIKPAIETNFYKIEFYETSNCNYIYFSGTYEDARKFALQEGKKLYINYDITEGEYDLFIQNKTDIIAIIRIYPDILYTKEDLLND